MRTPPSNEDSLPISLKLGNFDIETSSDGKPRRLGEGSFGITYLARHRYLENPAAIKVIGEKFLSRPRARERFLEEAKAVAKLRHPHIAQVYDFGPVDNGLFYAMEFCAGGNLSEWMKAHGAMSPQQIIAIAQQVASALKCCHSAKFIHRDLKPANIMLASADGPLIAKLIDFGLVQNEQTAQQEDQAAHSVGTPLYASPEQLLEQEVDVRSDLFSLGMTLWHIATGSQPDAGNRREIERSRLDKESYEPRISDNLPPQLRSIIAQLVEKDRGQRFDSASQLLDALNRAAAELNLPTFTDLHHTEGTAGRETGKPEAYNAPPLVIETYVGSLGEDFNQTQPIGESITGKTYRAWPKTPGAQPLALHVLDPSILEAPDLLAKVCATAGKLAAIRPPGVLNVGAIRRYDDATVIIMEAPPERDLVSELLEQGKISPADARVMLEHIAATSDRLIQAELPGIELSGAQIFVTTPDPAKPSDLQPTLVPRFLFKRDCGAHDPGTHEDVSATLDATTSAEGAPDYAPGQFARLLYRIIAGRKLPEVASKSIAGYVPIPELQEESNRTLAQIIAGEIGSSTCTDLITRILALEGLSTQTSTLTGTRTGTSTTTQTASTRYNPTATATRTAPPAPARFTPAPLTPIAPLRHAPAQEPRKSKAAPITFAILALALIGGGYWWWSGPAPESSGSSSSPNSESLPAGYALTVIGEEMKSAKFTLANTPLEATRNKDGWELKLPATTLPAEITGSAIGYVTTLIPIKYRGDAEKPIHFTPEREKGTIAIRRTTKHSDYQDVGANMMRLLPEEEGHVPRAKYPLKFPVDIKGGIAEIPTGIYRITLVGNSNLVTERRLIDELEVKAGSNTPITLPPSWVGTYTANIKEAGSIAAGGVAQCRFDIQPDLASSKFSYHTTEASMEECRLDKNGNFQARILWSKAQEGRTFDWKLSAKREGETLTLNIEEYAGFNQQIEADKQRKPYSAQQWNLSGTLQLAQ